ncbi:GNAT family N-acetyltransferase [Dyella psychrodurans]|uniref:N-acetyltransferase n=1 Tax=Dyella psychrodurans TaxID=1927960 RepID=A0A370XBG2_9GAMM|nr:GNAT family protein [Dyella psychrodurans]RDS85739.1 N-acetyltransferase [Dyella psychrodurans]
MELATARLRLDALREDDADALFRYRSDPSVALYQGWCPETREDVLDFIRAQCHASLDHPDGWFQRAIRLSGDGTLIGDMGVYVPRDREGSYEFGITLAPLHQRKGFAREAASAVLGFLFEIRGARRVQASIDPRNLASAALLRSLGMREEAHFRKSLKVRGEWVDDVIFALLASEWPPDGARV